MAQQATLLSQRLPEFRGKVRSKRREQENKFTLDIGQDFWRELAGCYFLFHSVQGVDQFHDGASTAVERPASLEVVVHSLVRLLKLALDGAGRRRGRCGSA